MDNNKSLSDLAMEDWKRNNPDTTSTYPPQEKKSEVPEEEKRPNFTLTKLYLKIIIAQVIINIAIAGWASYDAAHNTFGGQQAWLFMATIPILFLTAVYFVGVFIMELVRFVKHK